MNALGAADRWLLLEINRHWTCPWLDTLMPALTDLHRFHLFAFGAAPAALAWWLWRERSKALRILATAALAIALADALCYRAIKPWAGRLRPAPGGVPVVLRSEVGGTLGFPSNHAANMSAAALVLGLSYPAWSYAFASAAIAVAYSRVYVGVHYPADVVAGLIIGAGIGALCVRLLLRARHRSHLKAAEGSF